MDILQKKKIIDAFTFFNEFSILKLRLNYLNDIVDHFVICESNYTFSGKEKPYYLDDILNELSEDIRRKIIRLKYEPNISEFDFPENVTEYKYENYHDKIEKGQRDFIGKNLSNFSLNDFMMLGAVDEIPKKEIIHNLVNQIDGESAYSIKQDLFFYNFRTYLHSDWCGTVVSLVKNFVEKGTDYFHNLRFYLPAFENSGWHFSYFGDIEDIKHKIETGSHQEYNKQQYKNESNIIQSIKDKRYLFDENYSFKEYNFKNISKELREIIMEIFPAKYYSKIFVFGANGMLGKYVTKYISSEFEVIPITRNEINLQDDFSLITEKYDFQPNDVIINAAGIIKQRNYSPEELIRVNSLFPHFLSTLGCNVIHITTDCVFSGKDGSYDEESPHDCLDDYGKSKSLGECEDLTVIRTSIIGEELLNKKSLIEWVKSNQNTTINGYLNHFWNGVTCLELSKHILNIIQNNSYWEGIRHYFSPDTVNKYQLVSYINEIYELNNNVNPVMSYYCDRSLSTKYESPVSLSIKEQILELKQFELNSSSKETKLKNFPSFNFISITESEERRKILYSNLEKYGITNVRPHIYERYDEKDHIVHFDPTLEFVYNEAYLGSFTSHLKAIREWYESTDEEYAFFCEDDISFETIQYWNFTWEEFFNIFPSDWSCVQLSLTKQNETMFYYFKDGEVHLRNRWLSDWSCLAYLISRKHAKNLLDTYYDGKSFVFEYKGIDKEYRMQCQGYSYTPTIETIMYSTFDNTKIYAFPLFVEDIQSQTIVWDNKIGSHSDLQIYSYSSIIEWWKTKGINMSIDDLQYKN